MIASSNMRLIGLAGALAVAGPLHADFVKYTNFEAWQDAAGPFHTVTFEEFGQGTTIRDHYADLGLNVVGPADDFITGGGLQDNNILLSFSTDIFLEFSTPQFEFALHTAGPTVFLEVFNEGEQVFVDVNFSPLGFGGLVSDQPFDAIRIAPVTPTSVHADNLYFTVPAPGAFALLTIAGLIGPRRRNRPDSV